MTHRHTHQLHPRILALLVFAIVSFLVVGSETARAAVNRESVVIPPHHYGPLQCNRYQTTIGTIRAATSTVGELESQAGVGVDTINGDGTLTSGGNQWIYFRLVGYSYTLQRWFNGPVKRVYDGLFKDGLPEQWVPGQGWINAGTFDDVSVGTFDAFLHPSVGGLWYFKVNTYWEPPSTGDWAALYDRTSIVQGGLNVYTTFPSSNSNSGVATSGGYCRF